MRKYYFTITSILVLTIGMSSCSNEETKTQNQVAARPSVPILDTEVRIGNQIWMAKNLNVNKYRNGDPIPQVQQSEAIEWETLTTGAWCYWRSGNTITDGRIYGKLYNWYAVNDPRGLAPVGYHIPTEAEWNTLIAFLGGGNVAGGKIKAISPLWRTPNTGATNSSGFTALPGGFCDSYTGSFYNIGFSADWWSSTSYDASTAFRCVIYNYSSAISEGSMDKRFGISVRCIKD
ncbi:fibrobacter succinogenes major paralogous domain-containing protein [Flavobacterium sp.]|uniref:fibrobacter succinogenes major paralogous domain-containing protein n=1 Tax=Flavobacterium sp. TaxID=239 RepID=UPI00260AC3B2|nr:fibrobacter succinogenes major paralogous domain-containing protein [Flavobacterium sp.]